MAGLLNIGEMGALALHVLAELAALREEDPQERRTINDIARHLHASVHTLHKVARRLIMLGMVEGTRGANGGLRLVADPAAIRLLDVLEGIEGRHQPNGCMFAKRVCPAGAPCAFTGVTASMEKMVRDYFINTTIADLCAEPVR